MPDTALKNLDQVKVPDHVRSHLGEFVDQLIHFYSHDLVSIAVFGSAASGGYSEAASDLNLLVIYSDLNIADLDAVAELARTWLKKQRFVPRFLSLRNLTGAVRYFQVDFLDMRNAHVTLYGEDVLDKIEVRPADLHWQLAHEMKRMRMRIKQQFWRAAGDEDLMRRILVRRFTSILHLIRPLLFLQHQPAPLDTSEIADVAVRLLGLDPGFFQRMSALKTGKLKLRRQELTGAFSEMMNVVRILDEHIDRVVV
jgi:predicted nucleotidyltransferase